MSRTPTALVLPALRTQQGRTPIYLLFMRGRDILRVADICRATRDQGRSLEGFQRKEIREHVNEIAQYLDNGGALFPNAIILALEPGVKFDASRGTKPDIDLEDVVPGRLAVPVLESGRRLAWIVDGQQRSLALEKSSISDLVVPVVAFATDSIDVQREQFILVNRAKPLSKRLIDELLPETSGVALPRELTMRQLPSRLCNTLNTAKNSPFRGLIRRVSEPDDPVRVITDSAVLAMIKRSLDSPNGALAGFKALSGACGDATAMLQTLIDFWSAVKQTFPDAWGKAPAESRLMHSVGITAMGDLMDRIAARLTATTEQQKFFKTELGRIADDCAWTGGRWPLADRGWDEFENTKRDIKTLSQTLVQIYASRSRR